MAAARATTKRFRACSRPGSLASRARRRSVIAAATRARRRARGREDRRARARGGDEELLACMPEVRRREVDALEVTRDEWDAACDREVPADRAALGKAAMRVREFHRKRIPSSWEMREEGGGFMGQRVRPLARVGLYAPGGKAAYPSTVIMNAVPASVVEVPEICSPRRRAPTGSPPEVLMAARVAGVHRIFKMGGAHAIAAFAYGTESVPRVDKIVGPGNVYVATRPSARLRRGRDRQRGRARPRSDRRRPHCDARLDRGRPALAGRARRAGRAVLITHAKALVPARAGADRSSSRRSSARRSRSSRSRRAGAIVVARDLDEARELANRYAPEHLMLALDDPDAALKRDHQRGRDLPRALYARRPRRLPGRAEPRAADRRHGALLLAARRRGLPEAHELHALRAAEAARARRGRDPPRGPRRAPGHGVSVELRLEKIRRARREREAARERAAWRTES